MPRYRPGIVSSWSRHEIPAGTLLLHHLETVGTSRVSHKSGMGQLSSLPSMFLLSLGVPPSIDRLAAAFNPGYVLGSLKADCGS